MTPNQKRREEEKQATYEQHRRNEETRAQQRERERQEEAAREDEEMMEKLSEANRRGFMKSLVPQTLVVAAGFTIGKALEPIVYKLHDVAYPYVIAAVEYTTASIDFSKLF